MDLPMNMASAGADMFSGALGSAANGAKEMVSTGTEFMTGAMDQMSGMAGGMGSPMGGGMGPPMGPPMGHGHRPHHPQMH